MKSPLPRGASPARLDAGSRVAAALVILAALGSGAGADPAPGAAPGDDDAAAVAAPAGAKAPAAAADLDLLRRADRARGNLEGIGWEVTLRQKDRLLQMDVLARGYDFVARSLAPAKHKGDTVLMVRHNMWFHQASLSKPVPISQRQKLVGSASYGDIPATNYSDDYTVVEAADEVRDGEDLRVLTLEAIKGRKTTYDRIRYWISKPRGTGLAAEYFTISGKLIKSARMAYENRIEGDGLGQPFISRIVFTEALVGREVTTMDFVRPVLKAVPPSSFDLNLLRR